MKIDKLKINGFGKIKNREIELKDGIHIIYGKNESGKSTILKFITGMLFGIAKNKNGKNISDFERYKPWEDSVFSGKMKYTLENGEEYEIFREFKKKNPVIYNHLNEDISKEFRVDKAKEMNFFEQQTGIDEFTFVNTTVIHQQEVKLEKSDTNIMIQKISNLVSTGNDTISFKKSMEKLNKLQNERIGTERTKQKPINIVENNIKNLLEEKKKLEQFKKTMKMQEASKNQINQELEKLENRKEFLKKAEIYFNEKKMKNAEMEFQQNLLKEYEDKLEKIKQKMETNEQAQKHKKRTRNINYKLIVFITLIAGIAIFVRNVIIDLMAGIVVLFGLIFDIVKKQQNKKKSQFENVTKDLENEYKIEKENYQKKRQEFEQKQKNLKIEDEKAKALFVKHCQEKVEMLYVEKVLNGSIEVEKERESTVNAIQELNLQNCLYENQKQNMDEKLEQLIQIDEKLIEEQAHKQELEFLNSVFLLTKECLENAYYEMKNNISPKFEQKLCEITAHITDEKYQEIKVSDENGLSVEIENGSYMPVERLSIGTIDELYLALRLSMLSEITTEKLPIFLDETFVHFDDKRLKNILCYLQDQYYDNQIFIFTCSNREEKLLNELKIDYQLIEL